MMQSTWHLLLVLGHLALVAGIYASESSRPSWPAPPLTFGSGVLLGVAALYSSDIEIVTESGTTITTSEPFVGIYALVLAVVAFVLALIITILWLPTGTTRGDARGI